MDDSSYAPELIIAGVMNDTVAARILQELRPPPSSGARGITRADPREELVLGSRHAQIPPMSVPLDLPPPLPVTPSVFRRLLAQWPTSILLSAIGVFNGVVIVPKYRNELNLEGLIGTGVMDADILSKLGIGLPVWGAMGIPLILAAAALIKSFPKLPGRSIFNRLLLWVSPLMNTFIVVWLVWCHIASLLACSVKASTLRSTLVRTGLYTDARDAVHQELLSQQGGWLSRSIRPAPGVGPIGSLPPDQALELLKFQTKATNQAPATWVAFYQVRPLLELHDVLRKSHADAPELVAALEAARTAAARPFKDWEEVRAWQKELLNPTPH